MNWETVMGLEVHVELATKSKIFCSCTTQFGGEPNTHCCPICTGMPGTLPVLNEKVLEFALKAGIALNCEINRYNKFDRKNYFYPDLPKAYQISQLYIPFAHDGRVDIVTASGLKKSIRIHEIHMEEDAGKLVHSSLSDISFPDYNRCGVPLIEIVSEADFRSAEEVIAYLEKIKSIFQYLGVSDCKMQEGSMRADVNISMRPVGEEKFGTRTEMKNINSFKAIEHAIAYESKRQTDRLERGERVIQETRRWDDNKGKSFAMRSKENAQDYRYFPEPDIPPIVVLKETLERLKSEQPELAHEKKARYMSEFGLSDYDAGLITSAKEFAHLFESAVALCGDAKLTANWILGDLFSLMKEKSVLPEELDLDAAGLARLVSLVKKGDVNRNTAHDILVVMFDAHGPFDIDGYIKQHNLSQVDDEEGIRAAVRKVIAENPATVEEYRSGKTKVFSFFIGQTMKLMHGKAKPATVNRIVTEELAGK